MFNNSFKKILNMNLNKEDNFISKKMMMRTNKSMREDIWMLKSAEADFNFGFKKNKLWNILNQSSESLLEASKEIIHILTMLPNLDKCVQQTNNQFKFLTMILKTPTQLLQHGLPLSQWLSSHISTELLIT